MPDENDMNHIIWYFYRMDSVKMNLDILFWGRANRGYEIAIRWL